MANTEAVINRLTLIKTLRVAPLVKVRPYAESDQDPLAAGRALGVDAVLDARFEQTDKGLRVRSRLLRTSDGAVLTSEEWFEPPENILNVPSRLAATLVDALEPTMTPPERVHLRKQDTSSPDAFRHYLYGRYHLEIPTLERTRLAEREFREAVRLDAQYARAHAGVGLALLQMVWSGERRGIDVMGPAKDADTRSLAGFAPYPDFDPLRSTPRFQALCARVGLTDEINAELAAARQAVRH